MMRRRQFLAGGAALGAGAALGRVAAPAESEAAPPAAASAASAALDRTVAFDGARQAGILTPRPRRAVFASFDVITSSREELADALRELSVRARAAAAGYEALLGAPADGPTPDSGLLGPHVDPESFTATVGFGASLFDGRFGLASKRPAGLTTMPAFPDDALEPEQCHGDVLVQLCAQSEEKVIHALRDLMRATRGVLALRWKVDGFLPDPARERGAGRNLLGFKDGTANPDVTDGALMDQLVWTGDEQPTWARGGTFAVVRIVRNRVEFWDRVARTEQELMIGRDKGTGAPLGKSAEGDDPAYEDDPNGKRIPLDAHMRLARPRDAASEASRILRRGYNYDRGVDAAGQLDMGLVFTSFQRSVQQQFEVVQRRLAGEPLVDYVVPTGGGYFFLPPGSIDARDFVGAGLFV
jgi:deferrochelatase/peroxidase EfeB